MIWASGGWDDLPMAIGYLNRERESRIINKLYSSLNMILALELELYPNH